MGMFGISFKPPRLPRNCFFDAALREVDGVAGPASAPPAGSLALLRGRFCGIDAVVMPGIGGVFKRVN